MSATDGFKMLEKAPYDQFDVKNLTEANMTGAKEVERLYGPVFTTTFIKYALKAVAAQTAEQQQPEDIKTLDQLTDYLVSKTGKLSKPPYFIVFWAQYVTMKKLEGSLGAGYQMGLKGTVKRTVGLSGDLKQENADIDKIMLKIRQLTLEKKIAPFEFGYKKNGDGSLEVLHGGCPYTEGCQLSAKEALIQRPDARISCGCAVFICQFLKNATGNEWDHTVLQLAKPDCIAKVFMI